MLRFQLIKGLAFTAMSPDYANAKLPLFSKNIPYGKQDTVIVG